LLVEEKSFIAFVPSQLNHQERMNSMTDAEDKTTALLAQLWIKNRPIIEERLATLDRASAAAASGGLNADMRKDAASAAHKLAGALGMYGYDEGTQIARQIDALLSSNMPGVAQLADLIARLRAAVFPEGSAAAAG
jgi:HPt (histidine-containing phosphotransfer) domain-containing protein